MQLTIDQALSQAVEAHKAGNYKHAERLYRAIINVQPTHSDANHNLGLLMVRVGKPLEALDFLKTAFDVQPKRPQYWISYISTLLEANRPNEAWEILKQGKNCGIKEELVKNIERRLKTLQKPSQPNQNFRTAENKEISEVEASSAITKSGIPANTQVPSQQQITELHIAYDAGDYESVIKLAGALTKKYPNHPIGWMALGSALIFQGKFEESLTPIQQSLMCAPEDAQAYNILGVALRELGRLTEAEANFRNAIRMKPNCAEAYFNLGLVLKNFGNLTEAAANYSKAIHIKPEFYEAHNNLGEVLRDLGQLKEAAASSRKAIEIHPNFAEAHLNLGNALKDLGRLNEAEASYREAIRINPDYVLARRYIGSVLKDLGRFTEAEASYREALRIEPECVEAFSNLLFSLNYLETLDPHVTLIQAKRYGTLVSSTAEPKFSSWHVNQHSTKLKVGFVSGDLNNHPVGYFIEGLIREIDKFRFEVYAFPTTRKTDDLTDRVKPHFDHWIPICGKADSEAASVIHNQGIQILIDLSGHTAHNRLPVFAYKPAPVQVSWLGYFATTGLPEMDYFLGDPIMSPQNEADHFCEKVWNLPQTWLCLTPPSEEVKISNLPASRNGHITFGCFGNLSKMNDRVVNLWTTVLRKMPDSKLFLKSRQLADADVIKDVQKKFANQGVSTDRLLLAGPSSRNAYLAAYNQVDIVLDTFPYPGGTTSVDALWMGVPVLTLRGDRFLSHLGESIATNAAQSHWIAQDSDDYVGKAIKFACDLEGLTNNRRTLRERVLQSPLFKINQFAKHFEATLWGMWNARCENLLEET